MKESKLRKIHRYIGIILAFFLLLQGGSGMLIALGQLFDPHAHSDISIELIREPLRDVVNHEDDEKHGILGQVHHKEGTVWHFYRVLVGAGLLGMVFSGIAIFVKIQVRSKKT